MICAGVHDEPVEPGVPAVRVTQDRQAPPGVDQGILDGILRLVRVMKQDPRDGVEPIGGGRRENLEGFVVTTPCCFDEIALQAHSA